MMSRSVVSHLLLTRCEKILHELYIEPQNEEIVWTFLLVGNEEGEQAEAKSQQQKKQQRKKKKWDQGTFRICYQTQDQKSLTKEIIVLSYLLV